MADKQSTEKAEAAKQEEPTYEHDRLIGESYDFFDQPPHVVAGALVDAKKNLTLEEAKKEINSFLKREVTTPPEED